VSRNFTPGNLLLLPLRFSPGIRHVSDTLPAKGDDRKSTATKLHWRIDSSGYFEELLKIRS